jgi:hypothetical protein
MEVGLWQNPARRQGSTCEPNLNKRARDEIKSILIYIYIYIFIFSLAKSSNSHRWPIPRLPKKSNDLYVNGCWRGGQNIYRLGYAATLDIIVASPRPLTIMFERTPISNGATGGLAAAGGSPTRVLHKEWKP